jgi:hypothetical protein
MNNIAITLQQQNPIHFLHPAIGFQQCNAQ